MFLLDISIVQLKTISMITQLELGKSYLVRMSGVQGGNYKLSVTKKGLQSLSKWALASEWRLRYLSECA